MKYRVTIKTRLADYAKRVLSQNFMSPDLVQTIQNEVVEKQIKGLIKSGRSPVSGYGRFEAYKDPNKYPGAKGSRLKPVRPVNLTLSGDMLAEYKAARNSYNSVKIGISESADFEIKQRAKANNLGLNGIPQRRFIPQPGESFTISIMRTIKNLFTERLKKLLSL